MKTSYGQLWVWVVLLSATLFAIWSVSLIVVAGGHEERLTANGLLIRNLGEIKQAVLDLGNVALEPQASEPLAWERKHAEYQKHLNRTRGRMSPDAFAQVLHGVRLNVSRMEIVYHQLNESGVPEAKAAALRDRCHEGMLAAIGVLDSEAQSAHRRLAGASAALSTLRVQLNLLVLNACLLALACGVLLLLNRRNRLSRQSAEESLQASERKYRDLVEMSNDLIWSVDAEGRLTFVNEAARNIYGYPPADVIGRPFTDFMAEIRIEEDLRTFERVKTGEPQFQYETVHIRKDGRPIHVSLNAAVLRDANGQVIGATGTLSDISERKVVEETLMQNELRLRTLLENMPVLVNAFDENGNTLLWNRECERVTGYSAREIVGNPAAMKLLYPKSHLLDGQRPGPEVRPDYYRNLEWDMTHRDGTSRTISWSNISARFPIRGWATWGIGVDITQRKQAEDALRRSEARFRELFEHAPIAIAETDFQSIKQRLDELRQAGVSDLRAYLNDHDEEVRRLAGLLRVVNVNEAFVRQYGGDRDRPFSSPRSIFTEETYDSFKEELIAINENRAEFESRSSGKTEAGHQLDEIVRWIAPVENGVPNYSTVIVAITDITPHVKMMHALRDSEERFRQLTESIQEVFWLSDWTSQSAIYVSPAYESIWGRSRESLFQDPRSWTECIHPDDRSGVIEAYKRDAVSGNFNLEFRIVRDDSQVRWIHAQAFPIRDASGEVKRLAGIAEDITQRKQVEEALQAAHDELETRVSERTEELYRANQNLRHEVAERMQLEEESRRRHEDLAHVQRLSTMGEMATGLAHELNQPLSAIVSYTHGCLRRLETGTSRPEDLVPIMTEIAEQAQRAGKIIRGIRDFVRKGQSNRTVLEVNELVREAAAFMDAEARRLAIDVHLDLEDDLPPIEGDAIQLEQVILNLMRNSVEAIGQHHQGRGALTIRTRRAGEEVEIATIDTGPGMSDDVSDRLFEPFFTTKDAGLGMGLSICRSIIEAHGGHLHLSSEPGIGTTARIVLATPSERTEAHAAG